MKRSLCEIESTCHANTTVDKTGCGVLMISLESYHLAYDIWGIFIGLQDFVLVVQRPWPSQRPAFVHLFPLPLEIFEVSS